MHNFRTRCGLWLIASSLCALSCSDEGPNYPPPGENCGFEQDDPFVFTEVSLDAARSGSSCPEVTVDDVNGADEPDCDRRLEGCELVLSCTFEPLEGLEVRGRGRLTQGDSGDSLSGEISVEFGETQCFYDVAVEFD